MVVLANYTGIQHSRRVMLTCWATNAGLHPAPNTIIKDKIISNVEHNHFDQGKSQSQREVGRSLKRTLAERIYLILHTIDDLTLATWNLDSTCALKSGRGQIHAVEVQKRESIPPQVVAVIP